MANHNLAGEENGSSIDPCRLLKKAIQQGRRRVETGGVPLEYVEDFDEPRTKIGKRRVLARRGWAGGIWAFFSSLLDVEAEVDNIRFFDDVIFTFEAKQPFLLYLRL